MNWQSERLILELLFKHRELQPLGGLDLIGLSNGKLSRGTVYVWLSQLEDEGLVEGMTGSTAHLEPGMLPVRRYRLTTKGMNLMYAHAR